MRCTWHSVHSAIGLESAQGAMGLDEGMWSALVPVKAPDEAKSRLLPADDPHRAEFAMAFLEDVLTALVASPLERCAVVSNDVRVRRIANNFGVTAIDDPMDLTDPLNAALMAGARALGGDVLAVVADLPCLTPDAVRCVLSAATTARESSFVGDAAGTGTTILAMRPGAHPSFGPRSRARHVSAGYTPLTVAGVEGVRIRRDVDSPVDLWDAERIGVGVATQRVLDWSSAP
jgi:2-phospho-L-lactate/phosphoenolpyruvate guanylyltransferase